MNFSLLTSIKRKGVRKAIINGICFSGSKQLILYYLGFEHSQDQNLKGLIPRPVPRVHSKTQFLSKSNGNGLVIYTSHYETG